MADIHLLIKQYWSGDLNQTEKQLLFEMLEEKVTDYSDNEYKTFLQLVNEKETDQNKKDPELRQLLDKIEGRLGWVKEPAQVHSITKRRRLRWVAAAAVLLGAISAWWLLSKTTKNVMVASNATPEWITYKNGENSIKDTMLSDGSIIKMYPKTEISFVDGFKESKREIKFTGKALFKVARDTSRPFTVYAGGFSTNALGTEFEVNTLTTGAFVVKLLKGKVVVKTLQEKIHPMSDVYLSPGENLVYNLINKKLEINSTYEKRAANKTISKPQEKGAVKNPPELVFTKLPLSVIFQQLEVEYSIIIDHNELEISDKEFSGSFHKTDTPKAIIKTIAKKFGWKVHKENKVYKIEGSSL